MYDLHKEKSTPYTGVFSGIAHIIRVYYTDIVSLYEEYKLWKKYAKYVEVALLIL